MTPNDTKGFVENDILLSRCVTQFVPRVSPLNLLPRHPPLSPLVLDGVVLWLGWNNFVIICIDGVPLFVSHAILFVGHELCGAHVKPAYRVRIYTLEGTIPQPHNKHIRIPCLVDLVDNANVCVEVVQLDPVPLIDVLV